MKHRSPLAAAGRVAWRLNCSGRARLIAGAVQSLALRRGHPVLYVGYGGRPDCRDGLAEYAKVSRSTAIRAIAELEAAGVLRRARGGGRGRANTYSIGPACHARTAARLHVPRPPIRAAAPILCVICLSDAHEAISCPVEARRGAGP